MLPPNSTLQSFFYAEDIVRENLPIGKVRRQVERYYKIEFSDLSCFTEVIHIRKTANAFKHREGFKDFRRDPGLKLLEKFEPTRENAYQAIDGARAFLRALWKKSKVLLFTAF